MCVFPKKFQYFATSPSQRPGCYWFYRKWPANKGDSEHSDLRSPTCRGWVAVNFEKKLMNTLSCIICIYITTTQNNNVLNSKDSINIRIYAKTNRLIFQQISRWMFGLSFCFILSSSSFPFFRCYRFATGFFLYSFFSLWIFTLVRGWEL